MPKPAACQLDDQLVKIFLLLVWFIRSSETLNGSPKRSSLELSKFAGSPRDRFLAISESKANYLTPDLTL